MDIEITEQDREQCAEYADNDNCILATAIKRTFPGSSPEVYTHSFVLGNQGFKLSDHDADAIQGMYHTQDKNPWSLPIVNLPYTVSMEQCTKQEALNCG